MCLEFEEVRKRDLPHQRERTVYGCRETNWHEPDYQLFVPPYDHRQCSEGDAPLSSATAEARLKLYLKQMKADEGETLPGFRSGCAITLALTGADLSEIMEHVGWARRHTALYYLQLAKVLNPNEASASLAETSVNEVATPWKDTNELKWFVCAFPSATHRNDLIL